MWPSWPLGVRKSGKAGIEQAIACLLGQPGQLVQDVRVSIWNKDTPLSTLRRLLETVSQCRNLRRLRITFRKLPPDVVLTMFTNLTFASSLEVYASNLAGAEGASFFALHPNLRCLELTGGAGIPNRPVDLELSLPLPRLYKVYVSSQLETLSILRGNPVAELRLDFASSEIIGISPILSAIRTSSVLLERLTLEIPEFDDNLRWYEGLLAYLPGLKLLSIEEDWPNLGARQVDVLAALPQLETLHLEWFPRAGGYKSVWSESIDGHDLWREIPTKLKRCKALKCLELCEYPNSQMPKQGKRYQRASYMDDWAISVATWDCEFSHHDISTSLP